MQAVIKATATRLWFDISISSFSFRFTAGLAKAFTEAAEDPNQREHGLVNVFALTGPARSDVKLYGVVY
jgi:hypothetical protein